MRTFTLLLVLLTQLAVFGQQYGVSNIIVTPIDESSINVRAHVTFPTVTYYVEENVTIQNNVIDLSICYDVTILTTVKTVITNTPINTEGLSGSYTLNLNVYDAMNGCYLDLLYTATMDIPLPLEEEVTLSIQDRGVKSRPLIYPNPVLDKLVITTTNNAQIENIAVYDLSGKPVIINHGAVEQIAVSHLPKGIYLLKVQTNQGFFTSKLVKQ